MTPTDAPPPRITLGEWLVVPLVWLALAVLVNPLGEFALNDDWAFSTAVRNLVEDGRFDLTDWRAMTLVAHVLWGALVTWPFGFSLTALRLGTLILGAAGLLACLGLFREAGLSRRTSRAATLLVAANPIFFLYAYTFMTDVPFFAATIGAMLFWMRWQRTRSRRDLVLMLLLLALATLVRQVAVGVGVGLALATIARRGLGLRSLAEAIGVAAFALVVLAAHDRISAATIGLPNCYTAATAHLQIAFFEMFVDPLLVIQRYGPFVARRVIASILYLGLFCLPLVVIRTTLVSRRPDGRRRPTVALLTTVVVGGVALAAALAHDVVYPSFGLIPSPFPANTLTGLTLGPPTLSDSLLVRSAHVPPGPHWFRVVMTAAAVIGATHLLLRALADLLRLARWLLWRRRSGSDLERRAAGLTTFWLVGGGLYILPLWFATVFFDRYLLLTLPLALIVLGRRRARQLPDSAPVPTGVWRRRSGGFLLALMLGAAVAGTHDFLGWNRAAWAVADELVNQRGVARDDVDAGFAFDMWHRYPAFPTEPGQRVWWCPGTGRLMLTFGPVEGYRTLETRPLSRWLPGGPDRLWLLERTE